MRRYRPETMANVMELVRSKMPYRKAAEQYGVPHDTAMSWIRAMYGSITKLRQKRSPITVESLPMEVV